MHNEHPLISIIVPVYNVEKYLEQCIESIINQTYTNLEIILLNDGSKDSSGAICDRYAEKDSRILVVHKNNEGLAQTRNLGIELAKGEYVMFVDSDDWVDNDICQTLMDAIYTYNVESSMCSYMKEYSGESIPKILHNQDTVFDGNKFRLRICGPKNEELKQPENLDCYSTVWGKIYPACAVKKYKFTDLKEIGTAEDMLFNLHIFSDIDSMVYVNKNLYHYRKNVSTSITSVYKAKLQEQWENLYSKMTHIINSEQLGDEFRVSLDNRIALNTLGLGLNCMQGTPKFIELYKRVKKVLTDERRNRALKQLKIKYMPIYWKFFFLFAKWKFTFMLCIMLIMIEKLRGKK